MSTTRIQIDIPEGKLRELEALMEEMNIATRKDLFNNALTAFAWLAKQRREGRTIISVDASVESARELAMPVLEEVADTALNGSPRNGSKAQPKPV